MGQGGNGWALECMSARSKQGKWYGEPRSVCGARSKQEKWSGVDEKEAGTDEKGVGADEKGDNCAEEAFL